MIRIRLSKREVWIWCFSFYVDMHIQYSIHKGKEFWALKHQTPFHLTRKILVAQNIKSCQPSLNTQVNSDVFTASFWFSLLEKNTQNEHIIAHFEYFLTCHYSKTVWLAESLNEIKVTHNEKIFSHIKLKFSHFEKGLANVLTKKTFFCLTKINIIFTEIHRIKTKTKKIIKCLTI